MPDVLIIRHGESEWNLEHRWQGWLDAPLTPLGVRQAQDRASELRQSGLTPAVVHCSDLGRARRTAEIIAGVLGGAVRPHAGLRERCAGEWEGRTSDEIDEHWPGQRLAWRRGELSCRPGGEQDHEVIARVDAAIADVVGGPRPGLVVTHHGVLRLIATRAGADIRTLIPNLGGYWFDVDGAALARPVPLDPLSLPAEAPATE